MSLWVILSRLIGASFLGALIGWERESKSRPAGLRTHTLTALAAAVFTVITTEIVHSPLLSGEKVTVDPIRVIEAVTAGVAFLAAGTIIHARGRVQGLTTGATMWLAGAVGVACGMGYFIVAALATGICLLVAIGLYHFSGDGSVDSGRERE